MAQWAWVPPLPGGKTTEFWKCLPMQQRVFLLCLLLSSSHHRAAQESCPQPCGEFLGKAKLAAGVWRLAVLSWLDIPAASAPTADPRTGHTVNPWHSLLMQCPAKSQAVGGKEQEVQTCPAHTSHPPATSLLETRGDPNAKPAEQEIKRPLNSSRQGSQCMCSPNSMMSAPHPTPRAARN